MPQKITMTVKEDIQNNLVTDTQKHKAFLCTQTSIPQQSLAEHNLLALEPILIPKLRIYFADFPYLH